MNVLLIILVIILLVWLIFMYMQAKERTRQHKKFLDNLKRFDNEYYGKCCENCKEDDFIGKNLVIRNPDEQIFCGQSCYQEWREKNKDK